MERDPRGLPMPPSARLAEAASSPDGNGSRIAGGSPIPSEVFFRIVVAALETTRCDGMLRCVQRSGDPA